MDFNCTPDVAQLIETAIKRFKFTWLAQTAGNETSFQRYQNSHITFRELSKSSIFDHFQSGKNPATGRPVISRTVFPSTRDRDKAKPETQQM
jgi:hypothetical protein